METVSFQISNNLPEITGLPKDGESSAFKIKLMLDIQSCRLKKSTERFWWAPDNNLVYPT